ncbi:MAG TPA: hypothetical protein VGN12_12180 [Pirellulales bacterium]|jgi:DNA-binding CsgD family transcriptional regulator
MDTQYTITDPDDASRPPLFSFNEWRQVVHVLKLSKRQAEIVGYLMQSQTRSSIQRILKIKPSTFRTQYDRARARLGASDKMAISYRVFEVFRQIHGRD